MPSIVPGFDCDIFISYRQKDNKYDGWVTEFVGNLKKELDATFKEDVSIYFDIHPHDGLQDTHDVDASLREKLKSLIFIPILSHTYCDPNSFAWKNELLAFRDFASTSAEGLKVRLPNGNVASRILPVRIHELDASDIKLYESETGGLIRPVDFIFRSPGVNRPLRAKDDDIKEIAHPVLYRDQLNKVANAAKDLMTAITQPFQPNPGRPLQSNHPGRKARLAGFVFTIGLAVVALLAYLNFPSADKAASGTNSVAVLPFTNMSTDPEQEYFSDGVTEQIISALAQLKDIKVIARTSVMKYKKTSKSIAEIGKELNVTHVLEGSVRKSGVNIRVTAQLIEVNGESHLWAENFNNSTMTDIFQIYDSVSTRIATSLMNELVPSERERIKSAKTANPEAYEHYLMAQYISNNYFSKSLEEDFLKSELEFQKAIELDSNYAMAHVGLANLYDTRGNEAVSIDQARKYRKLRDLETNKAQRLAPQLTMVKLLKYYSYFYSDHPSLDSAYKYGFLAYASAPNRSTVCYEFGNFYQSAGLYPRAESLFKKAADLNPSAFWAYTSLGNLQLSLGNIIQAEKFILKAEKLDSNSLVVLYSMVDLNVSKGNYKEVERIFGKIKRINPNGNSAQDPFYQTWILAMKADKEAALKIMDASRDVQQINLLTQDRSSIVYCALGMKKEALDKLEKKPLRSYLELKNAKPWAILREEKRFKEMLDSAKKLYEIRMRKYPLPS